MSRDDDTVRAEQALLGAVLHDPAAHGHALGYVETGDFTRPWHGQVHAAMRRIQARGQLPSPHQVRAELRNDPDIPGHVHGQAWLITDLIHECPRPRHAPAYAGLVAESGVRQALSQAGGRMRQAAERDSLDPALAAAARARADLERSRERWAALPPEARTEIPGPGRDERDAAAIARQAQAVRDGLGRLRENLWAESQHGIEERLAGIAHQLAEVAAAQANRRERQAARQAARQARPAGPAGEQASRQCLKDFAARPEALDQARGWLRPEHFATPAQGETYAVMQDMRAAGKPVDPLTASREATRRGVQADLGDGTPAQAEASARDLHTHATTARISRAGQDIQASAADDAEPLTSVFRSADRSLRQAEAEAQIIRQHEPGRPPRPGQPQPPARPRLDRQPGGEPEPAEATR
jgi:replicative DNA helicase